MSKTDRPPTQEEFEAFLKTAPKRATRQTYKKYAKRKKWHLLEAAALTAGFEPPPERFLAQLWALHLKEQEEKNKTPS